MHWSKVNSSSKLGSSTFSIRLPSSVLLNILIIIRSLSNLTLKQHCVRWLQISVVVFELLNDLKLVLQVKLEGRVVPLLHVQAHALDLPLLAALIHGLLQKFASNSIALVWLQHRDGHNVAHVLPVFLDVFFAGDGAYEDVFQVGQL